MAASRNLRSEFQRVFPNGGRYFSTQPKLHSWESTELVSLGEMKQTSSALIKSPSKSNPQKNKKYKVSEKLQLQVKSYNKNEY